MLTFMSDTARAQIATWARRRAVQVEKKLRLPKRGQPQRVKEIAQSLSAAYELGYLRRVRIERRRAVPL